MPACSQCVKTRRVCPGYIQHFDLVLRDQTQSVRFNADRKRAGKKSPVRLNASDPAKCSKSLVKPLEPQTSCTSLIPRPCSDSSSPEPLQIVCRESSLDNASDVDSIPRALCEDPIQQAVNAFFGEFMMFNRHPDSQRGIVELLYPLYKSCHHDSLISLATSSVALAAVGGAHRRSTYYTLGYAIFGKALQMTKTAIDDPVESLSDETLITVLLLGVFEVSLLSSLSVICTGRTIMRDPSSDSDLPYAFHDASCLQTQVWRIQVLSISRPVNRQWLNILCILSAISPSTRMRAFDLL